MSPARNARVLAVRVLERVTDEGAFASRALDAELGRAQLSPRDVALATEIVYGALRVLPALDARYGAYLRSPAHQLDGLVRAALRVGTYQLVHLSRVPPHAAVDESVSIVRAARGVGLAGLVNAVLRRVAEKRPEQPQPPEHVVVPLWIEKALRTGLGDERARALLSARAMPPPLGLRVAPGLDRGVIAEQLRAELLDARIELGQACSTALLAWRAGDVRKLPAYAQGAITSQDEGSQLIAACVGAQPGETVADLCAGHGGKTTLLAERVGEGGHVIAVDLDERKLERIVPELTRLHIPEARVEPRAIDLAKGAGGLDGRFDRVLLDAACSGLGTVHRRPDLLLRIAAEDPARLADLQLAMLGSAARMVRPGGVLVYAVCSPTAQEGPEVTARFLAASAGDFEHEWAAPPESPSLAPDTDGVVRIGPWLSGLDGESPDAYQLVRLRRRAKPSGT